MCPVIEGADLTAVSTVREPLPESEYLVTVKGSEFQAEDKKTLIIKSTVESPEEVNGVHVQGREYWDFINLIQNDGKKNKIGWTTIKRYMEAAFGKGSAEAESTPPDTDLLNGQQVRLYLKVGSYKDKNNEDQPKNETKKIFEA